MRGASEEGQHRVLGGSLHTKGVYQRFISWLLGNLAVFETIVKSEAMVDAPGKFMLPWLNAL